MIKIASTITLILFAHGVLGQSPFARSYEVQADPMETTSVGMRVAETANGDLLLSSHHALHDSLDNTIYVSLLHRLTAEGSALWRKKLVSADNDLRVTGISELPDGTIEAVGTMGSGGADAALLRFNATGDLLLARRYAAVGTIGFNDIVALTDSTVLIAGYCFGINSGPLIMVASNDGTIQDGQAVVFPNLGGAFHRITGCIDGGWLLSGIGNGEVAGNGSLNVDLMAAKLDSTAALTWATRLERWTTWSAEVMRFTGGHEIPGQGFRIIADHDLFVPFGNGFLMAALTDQGHLTWCRKFITSYSFTARASMNISDTSLAITGGLLQGNVISLLGGSGTHLGTYVTHPGGSTFDAIRTADGRVATAGLVSSLLNSEADAPALIKDDPVPTMCTVEGVAMAQDTFGLTAYQDHVIIPFTVATSDLSPDLAITDQDVVESPQCGSVAITSEEPPSMSAWLAGDRLIVTGAVIERVCVSDLSGRTVDEAVLLGQKRAELDLSKAASGIYLVQVHGEHSIRMLKVFKER